MQNHDQNSGLEPSPLAGSGFFDVVREFGKGGEELLLRSFVIEQKLPYARQI